MTARVKVGAFLPTFLPAGPDTGRAIAAFARRAEELGYDSLWATDHLLHGSLFYRRPWLDPLTALGYAAAVTERVSLGTSVLVMPVRHPVILAKQIASLQAVCGDRFVLGAGTGWDVREFAAVGADKRKRGKQTDECIDVVRELLAGGPVHRGDGFYPLDGVEVGPVPSRPLRVWVAGGRQLAHAKSPEPPTLTRPVLARIGRAEGWITRPTSPPDQIRADIDDVRAYFASIDRDPSSLTVAHENFLHFVPTDDPERARAEQVERFTEIMGDGRPYEYFEQVYLTGTAEQVLAKLRARLTLGVSHVMLHTLEPSVRQLELWAEHLLPHLDREVAEADA